MKKNYFLSSLVVMLAITFVGCGGAGDGGGSSSAESDQSAWAVAVTADMLTAGQETYRLNCAPCHGAGGKGDGPGAATLNPKPRDHTNREYMDVLTDQKIADVVKMGGIVSGYPNMPSSPHIRGDDMVALVAFTRSLSVGAENVEEVDVKAQ